MATQYLPSIECRDARLCDLLKRVAENHEIDHGIVQGITHYNPGTGEIDFWFWPLDTKGVRIPPDQLSEEHMLLLFNGPCCFCAYLDGSEYTECKLGLAECVGGDQPLASGQYAFQCARNRCGYYVLIDQFFSHPKLMASTFPKRRDILDNGDFGLELTDESSRHLGFRQVANGNRNVLRGAHKLRRETPHIAAKWRADFEQLAVQGLCGDAFWDLFIQCMDCNVIMPRFLFPYKHSCSNRAIRQRHHIWDPPSPSFMNRLRYQSDDDDDTASDESGPSTAPCSPVPLRGSGLQLRSRSSIYQTPPPRPVPQSPIAKRKLHEVEDGDEGDDEGYLRACARRRLPSAFDDGEADVFTYQESSSDLPELADIINF